MANSYAGYTGNGSNRNFAVPFPYISQSHVTVKVNGVSVTFAWLNPSLIQTTVAPAGSTMVVVKRTTPTAPLVDYEDGSTLVETDLDTSALQAQYIGEELQDVALGMSFTNLQYDAITRRITNVGNPTAAQDAATKNYCDSVIAAAASAASVNVSSVFTPTLLSAQAAFAGPITVLDGQVMAVGCRTANTDGYMGLFRYKSGDTTTTFTRNALGFVDNVGRRWFRQYSGQLNALWFDLARNGTTDDYAGLNACMTSAVALSQVSVYVPEGLYGLSQTLNISDVSFSGACMIGTCFTPLTGFVGSSVLLVDDSTDGSSSDTHYEKFRILGNPAVPSVAGLKLHGNVLYCQFSDIRINDMTAEGIVIDGKAGPTVRPTGITWTNVHVNGGSGDGFLAKAGRHFVMINCHFENLTGRGIAATGSTEACSKFIILTPYIEHVTGTGIYFGEIDLSEVRWPLVNGYGNAVTPSYAFHNAGTAATRNLLVGSDFIKNGGVVGSTKLVRYDGGDRLRLEQVNLPLSELSISGNRGITINGNYQNVAVSLQQFHFSNGRAGVVAATPQYLAPSTGAQHAVYAGVSFEAVGYISFTHLRLTCSVNAGGTDTFTATLYVDGNPTALTCTAAAGGGIAVNTTNEVLVTPGQTYAVLLSTSATATTIPIDGAHISLGACM